MENEGVFSRLEKSVEKLLAGLDKIRQDKNVLQAELFQKEQENKELREEVARLLDDKNLIHERVTGLINSIEKWEKSSPEGSEGLSPMRS